MIAMLLRRQVANVTHHASKQYSSSSQSTTQVASNYRRPNYGGFYTAIMEQSVPSQRDDQMLMQTTSKEEKGGVVFYSRLAGYPQNRPAPDTAKMYAGVIVPARPEEPLNCCQSGCVHCVWDIYREDIEFYQQKRDEARQALLKLSKPIPVELGGTEAQVDIISQLDPTLQAFIKLEKELKAKRQARSEADRQ